MIGVRRDAPPIPALRGLGRQVDPDARVVDPHLHGCTRLLVHPDGRTVDVSWVRSASQGLHSVVVEYTPNAVQIGVRLGTRPAFANQHGCVVVRMIIEHTVVRLREPLRGRTVELLQPKPALTRTS